jgi:hypothetical protein
MRQPTIEEQFLMAIEPCVLARADVDGLALIGRTLHDLRGIRFDAGEGGNAPAGENPDADEPEDDDEPDEGADALGDAGKKALDSMKQKWKDAEKARKAAEAASAALQAKIDGTEATHQQELEQQRVRDEALSKANTRILKAEVRAQAAKKLSDPSDALLYLDLSSFEVGEDGEVDSAEIATAIDDLISKKPYLAAQGGERFQGNGDGGARNAGGRTRQLTEADLASMTKQQIVEAKSKGQLDKVLGRTS